MAASQTPPSSHRRTGLISIGLLLGALAVGSVTAVNLLPAQASVHQNVAATGRPLSRSRAPGNVAATSRPLSRSRAPGNVAATAGP
jgi:hypothetical protein